MYYKILTVVYLRPSLIFAEKQPSKELHLGKNSSLTDIAPEANVKRLFLPEWSTYKVLHLGRLQPHSQTLD
jgi:hypothetical protein